MGISLSLTKPKVSQQGVGGTAGHLNLVKNQTLRKEVKKARSKEGKQPQERNKDLVATRTPCLSQCCLKDVNAQGTET